MLSPLLLLSAFASTNAAADTSACSSGYVKDSLDEQIDLYTICLKNGGLSRGEIGWAFGSRGIAYLQKGDIDHALSDFTKSIQYDPKFGLSYFNRASVYLYYREDFQAAEADLTSAIERQPARIRGEALARRGVIRMDDGRCKEALTDFDASLKKDRKVAWVHGARAWLLATCGDDSVRNGAEALKSAQMSASLGDHWKAHDTLAAAYAEVGRFDDSVREENLALGLLAKEQETAALLRPALTARLSLYENHQPCRAQAEGACASREWLVSLY